VKCLAGAKRVAIIERLNRLGAGKTIVILRGPREVRRFLDSIPDQRERLQP